MNAPTSSPLARWHETLTGFGARLENGRVVSLPPSNPPCSSSRPGLCDLTRLAILAFSGPDAASFLHGQLSCDVLGLPADRATLGSYNTPKGRALATFLLWRTEDGFAMQLPAALAEPTRRRLAMYILRSKVKAEDRSEGLIRLGVAGTGSADAVRAAGLSVPAEPFGITRSETALGDSPVLVVALPGERFEVVAASVEQAAALWQRLAERACPTTDGPWELQAVRAGVGDVQTETTDQFVPQMLNLDVLGGVSFNKGCYPGQEIVARAHFLGRLKRRMCRALLRGREAPRAGDELFSPALPGQAIGTIVSCGPLPCGAGFEVLAVIQTECAARDDVAWKAPDGPRLQWLSMPYAVPDAPAAQPS